MRRSLVLCCLLAIAGVACRGGEQPKLIGPPQPTATSAPDEQRPAAAAKAKARMTAGTASVEGSLAELCDGDGCSTDDRAKARGTLAAPDSGFVLFAVSSRPASARAELTLKGTPAGTVELTPSTTMVMTVPEAPGRYTIALVAEWPDAKARWLFALTVAAP